MTTDPKRLDPFVPWYQLDDYEPGYWVNRAPVCTCKCHLDGDENHGECCFHQAASERNAIHLASFRRVSGRPSTVEGDNRLSTNSGDKP